MAPPKPRLTDWQPLSDTDPVPGDPQAVRDEIKHLNSVKDELNKQADRLKGIRDDDELRGKYATTLKEEAEVLEGQLRDLAKRYGRVVVPLGKWATELEQFQSEADTVCGRAAARQEELDAEDKAAKEKNPDPSPTDHESDPLRSLRTDLAKVLHERDTQGNKRAREIREAINNDGVEDSPWDDLIGWVHENADWIKVVIDVLGWVATALAVVALFIPGLNIAVFLLIAGLVVVGTRLLLVASGDASWMDVAIDSFGLLTMGIGRVGVGMLRGASTAARASARSARLLAGVRAHRGIMNELSTALATTTGGAATKAAIRGLMNTVRRGIIDDAAGAAINPGAVSRMTRLLHLGDDEVASLAANVARNAEAQPGAVSSGTQALARGGGRAWRRRPPGVVSPLIWETSRWARAMPSPPRTTPRRSSPASRSWSPTTPGRATPGSLRSATPGDRRTSPARKAAMPYMPERAIPEVARPAWNVPRFCCVVPVVGIIVYLALGLLTPSLAPAYLWGLRVLVSVAQLTLLVILVRHPWRRQRPRRLTWVLAMSWVLFLPALVTAYWPGVFAAPPSSPCSPASWPSSRGDVMPAPEAGPVG